MKINKNTDNYQALKYLLFLYIQILFNDRYGKILIYILDNNSQMDRYYGIKCFKLKLLWYPIKSLDSFRKIVESYLIYIIFPQIMKHTFVT